MTCKVSVLMPVYNGRQYLRLAIDSVLAQTFKDFELIVLDDGSTEDVGEIVRSYSDSRIRFVQRENRGLGATLNELIGLAKGEYLARMDADDVCMKDRFLLQVALLDANPDVVMVGGQIRFLVGDVTCDAFSMPVEHEKIYSELSEGRFPICHPCLMFRRSACVAFGGYRVAGAGEDLDFFLRMSEAGKIANVKELVLHYRLHSGSLSLKKQGELEKGYAYALYSARARRRGDDEPSVKEFEERVWSRRSLNDRIGARVHSFSERMYRGSIVARGNRQSFFGYLMLGLAGALRPRRTITRISQILSS